MYRSKKEDNKNLQKYFKENIYKKEEKIRKIYMRKKKIIELTKITKLKVNKKTRKIKKYRNNRNNKKNPK